MLVVFSLSYVAKIGHSFERRAGLRLRRLSLTQVRINRSSVKSIYDHFTEFHLKEIARDIVKIMKSAQYIGSASLDSAAENYEKKKARGVTGYNYYKVTFRGVNLRINMKVRNDIEEVPYSFNLYIKEKENL